MAFVTTITVVTIVTLRVKGCSTMLNNYNDVYTVVHCTCTVFSLENYQGVGEGVAWSLHQRI